MDQTTVPDTAANHRAAFVAALRQLADFVEANADLPVPRYPDILAGVSVKDDVEGAQIIARSAAILGRPIEISRPDDKPHFTVETFFGPEDGGGIRYRPYYIATTPRPTRPGPALVAAAALTPDADELPAEVSA